MSKIARYQHNGQEAWGLVQGDSLQPLPDGPFAALAPSGSPVPLSQVRLLAPVTPRKLICVGLNYRLHAAESGMAIPSEPMLFMVSPEAVIGPEETIHLDNPQDRIDYEAEIGIVIGRRCKNVAASEAASVVLGYTCANDVSNRILQKKDGQFTRAKSFDSYKPVGPWIETGLNPADLAISLRQNGETRQASRTSDMIFSCAEIVAFVSGIMTLEPGDLIITGTPEGVGPMAAGDRIEITIEGIGTLANPVA